MVVTEQTAHLESSENPEMEHDTSLCVFLFLFELYSCIFDRGAGAQPPLLGQTFVSLLFGLLVLRASDLWIGEEAGPVWVLQKDRKRNGPSSPYLFP